MSQTFDHGLSTQQLQTLKTILKQCPFVVEKVHLWFQSSRNLQELLRY